jgi:Family of unknown function (DUF5985)
MHEFLLGVMATLSWVAMVYFLRFWRETGDRLFVMFSAAFFLLGLTRLGLAVAHEPSEGATYLYWLRLFAFVIIVVAILDTNRR